MECIVVAVARGDDKTALNKGLAGYFGGERPVIGFSTLSGRPDLFILPDHSIPLIIHHASGLGDWIREVEKKEGCRFGRLDSIIEWWDEGEPG